MAGLFVGFSGPIGYDYWRGGDRPEHRTTPNAVLEDVTGLLLCYDELYFLSRDFCPEDMWHLPYVKFISEDHSLHSRAVTAHEQYSEVISEHGSLGIGNISGTFSRTIAAMTGNYGSGGIDNHSRKLAYTDGFNRIGNSADVDSVVIDMGIAASLQLKKLDVLTNSVATEVVDQNTVNIGQPPGFSDWHIDVATELGTIKVPNRLGPAGGYHEDIEALRSHPQIKAFRNHLLNRPVEGATPEETAVEMSELADDYARRSLQRQHRSRPIYHTVGRSALKPVGDTVAPPLGTLVDGAYKVWETVQEKRRLSSTEWAAFVVGLKS